MATPPSQEEGKSGRVALKDRAESFPRLGILIFDSISLGDWAGKEE